MARPLQTARPPAFIHGLTALPRELVHKVLDDLPMIKVLQIISHKIEYLDQCVISHFKLQRVFTSQADLDSVVDYFILYRDIKRWGCSSLALDSYLESYGTWNSGVRNYVRSLESYLISSIKTAVGLTPAEEKTLAPWGAGTCPPMRMWRDAEKLDRYWARWTWIRDAKEALNAEKALHWTRAADLMSSYPGKLKLKKPKDPGQGGPRPNAEHIASGLRQTARKVLKDRRILYDYQTFCGGASELILMPYDRYLWLFLENLTRKHSIDGETNAINSKFEKTSLHDESAPEEAILTGSEYPEDIAASLKIVMAGLFHVYTGSPLRIVPRIDWTPNLTSDGMNVVPSPRFIATDIKPANMHLCPVKRREPHDAQELDWLEAFMKVVTWMEDNTGGVEKSEKMEN